MAISDCSSAGEGMTACMAARERQATPPISIDEYLTRKYRKPLFFKRLFSGLGRRRQKDQRSHQSVS